MKQALKFKWIIEGGPPSKRKRLLEHEVWLSSFKLEDLTLGEILKMTGLLSYTIAELIKLKYPLNKIFDNKFPR